MNTNAIPPTTHSTITHTNALIDAVKEENAYHEFLSDLVEKRKYSAELQQEKEIVKETLSKRQSWLEKAIKKFT